MSYCSLEKGSHTWALNEEKSRSFIEKALELGINFFDTANVYSDDASQEVLGRALSQLSNSAESEKFECKENLLAKLTS
jgi:aryl-alcohol dehydrogenase-like predicted oxidoreductase